MQHSVSDAIPCCIQQLCYLLFGTFAMLLCKVVEDFLKKLRVIAARGFEDEFSGCSTLTVPDFNNCMTVRMGVADTYLVSHAGSFPSKSCLIPLWELLGRGSGGSDLSRGCEKEDGGGRGRG